MSEIFLKEQNPISRRFCIFHDDGESVALLYRTVPIAMIIDAKKYGFSKGISVDGSWGHPWDQAIYHKHFAEHAGPQDAAKLHL